MKRLTDDRTDEQKQSHVVLWGGTNKFLSGWGKAKGKYSYAFWACLPEHANRVEAWVRRRSDIQRVRQTIGSYRGLPTAVTHIYVVGEGHASLK